MRKPIALLAIIGGLLAALGGVVLAATTLFVQAGRGARGVQGPIVAASFGAAGIGYGLALVWAGIQSYRGRPARPFRLPGWGWLLLAFVVTLAVGQAVFRAGAAPLLPLFHIAAALLPSLVFVSLVAGSGLRYRQAAPARAAVGALAWGGLGGTGLAMLLESIAALALVALAAVWLRMADPGLVEQLQSWAASQLGRGRGSLPDFGPLLPLLTSPLVIAGVLGFVGLLAPLIEEFGKSLAVPIVVVAGRQVGRFDAFALGVAGGAGFAALESTLYGALGLGTAGSWAGVMALRGATAAIHCLASGLAGLGWQALVVEKRLPRALAFAALGAFVHGAWNSIAAGQIFLSLGSLSAGGNVPGLAATAALTSLTALMALLWLGAIAALPFIATRLARRAIPHDEVGPEAL